MTTFHATIKAVLGELESALGAVRAEEVAQFKAAVLAATRVFVAGKGRTGLQMQGFAMRLMHLGLTAHVVGEVTTPAIGAGDLLVIGSASGRTDSLVGYARKARTAGARVALITAQAGMDETVQADLYVTIPAPTPKAPHGSAPASIQPLGDLFEAALGLLLGAVIMQIMDDLGIDAGQMFARHANLE